MRRIICTLLFVSYSGLVLYLTLFGRPVYPGNPLGIVLGGWDFRLMEDGSDVHAFYNLFMLTPAAFMLLCILPDRTRSFLTVLRIAVVFSFAASLFIEVSQVIFCLGTMQISDLVYNTFSGALGGSIYYIIVRMKERWCQVSLTD
jgi:glycopeptide antibiotics resistance protein